jgi:hypothetical protein
MSSAQSLQKNKRPHSCSFNKRAELLTFNSSRFG